MVLKQTLYELMNGSFHNRPIRAHMVEEFTATVPNITETDSSSDLGAFKAETVHGSAGSFAMTDGGLRIRTNTGAAKNRIGGHYNKSFNSNGCVYESVSRTDMDVSLNQGFGDSTAASDQPNHCVSLASYSSWQSDDIANFITFQCQSSTSPARGYTSTHTGVRTTLAPFHQKIEMKGVCNDLSINGTLCATVGLFDQSISSYTRPHIQAGCPLTPVITAYHNYTPPVVARNCYVSYVECYNT